MGGYDLFEQIREKSALLDSAISKIKQRGESYAIAEKSYRVALAQRILTERENGTPVTIINDICRGDEEIADFKMQRDIAESMYRSALEAINVYKLEIKMLDAQISREWGGK